MSRLKHGAPVALIMSAVVLTFATGVAQADFLGSVVLNFETDSDGVPLVPGDGTQLNVMQKFLGYGVELGVADQVDPANSPLVVYNSNCGPDYAESCTGGDGDLATGPSFDTSAEGNVLIIQDRTRPLSEPGDDLNGGTTQFFFTDAAGVTLESISIIDLDLTAPPPQQPEMLPIFTVVQLIDGMNVETVYGPGDPAVNVTLHNPAFPNDNSLRSFDFESPLANVVQLDVGLVGDTGAIADIAYTRVPEPSSAGLALASIFIIAGWKATKRGEAQP